LIDRSYSARFNRWNVREPGLGRATAERSRFFSSAIASCVSVSPPGRGVPGGGIIPARSLPIIFSAVAA